ncbi:hypothetical protein LNY03_29265, partial [Pseudomonas nitroreducens]|uniref:hypothetical protein n=1 Tax=Pseudomonas nitroreducens TaxID=46680 RepID=UPI001FB7AEE3
VDRIGIDARVEHLSTPGHFRVRRRPAAPRPTVSVVMPTVGTSRPVWGVTRPIVLDALDSLLEVTVGTQPEVVVVVDTD